MYVKKGPELDDFFLLDELCSRIFRQSTFTDIYIWGRLSKVVCVLGVGERVIFLVSTVSIRFANIPCVLIGLLYLGDFEGPKKAEGIQES